MKGGINWYWICQECGVYKATPSRTNLYCSFCKYLKERKKNAPETTA